MNPHILIFDLRFHDGCLPAALTRKVMITPYLAALLASCIILGAAASLQDCIDEASKCAAPYCRAHAHRKTTERSADVTPYYMVEGSADHTISVEQARSASHCRATCLLTADCDAFSYNQFFFGCTLFNHAGGKAVLVKHSAYVSGVMTGGLSSSCASHSDGILAWAVSDASITAEFYAPPSVDCQSEPQSSYPFCDVSLPIAERVNDLVSRLSLVEKINQTSSIAPALPQLGINAYNWRSNCLHGWTNGPDNWPPNTYWTVFPNPMGLAAAFDYNTVLIAGQITSDEGRALHNINLAAYNGTSVEASSLNCFSPNVNIYRNPLWGRNMETFGEDTFHMARMGMAYTRGIQVRRQIRSITM